MILYELAQVSCHRIFELIFDAYVLKTGLNCRYFDQPNEECENLIPLFWQMGFSYLDLALIAEGKYRNGQEWSSIHSGYLRRALGESLDLRHIR